MLDERLLHRVELAVDRDPFYRGDLGPICYDGKDKARVHNRPVQSHRTTPTVPVATALLGTHEPQTVAQSVQQGFARPDLFVSVHEQFMTGTAAMADIVLPATTFLEHDDIYLGGAHTYLQLGRAVLPPYAECRSNHEVICGLAERLGARHPGFELSAVELIDRTLRASGLPDVESFPADGRLDCCPPFATGHFLDGFAHAYRKFHFRADWPANDPFLTERVFGPLEVDFDIYPTWAGDDRVVVMSIEKARAIGVRLAQ